MAESWGRHMHPDTVAALESGRKLVHLIYDMLEAINGVRARRPSPSSRVIPEVDGMGRLTDLYIAPGTIASFASSRKLVDEIMAAIRDSAADAMRQHEIIVQQTVWPDVPSPRPHSPELPGNATTELYAAEVDGAGAAADWRNIIYEVFDPDYSVGVACDQSGMIVGLHLGEEVWQNTDEWLADELVRVARLAHLKSQVGRRTELLYNGALPSIADDLGLPTEAAYILQEKAEFGRDY